MKYHKIVTAKFLSRDNRFVAKVLINKKAYDVHVKNTGRCRELLLPDTTVYLEDFAGRMGSRKMRYDLVAVEKGKLLINMDSQAPNKVVFESLQNRKLIIDGFGEASVIRPETRWENSRFDFYLKNKDGREAFLEVKGVTLENNGIASFPDAPTERGVKHLEELISARKAGYLSYVLFVIQMEGIKVFSPNDITHKAFGDTLREAHRMGVGILTYDCIVSPDSLYLNEPVGFLL